MYAIIHNKESNTMLLTYHEIINETTLEVYHYPAVAYTKNQALTHAHNHYGGWGIKLTYNGTTLKKVEG